MLPTWFAVPIFLTLFVLLVGSQVFWFRRAHRLVRGRPRAWQRWLLGVPIYAWFLGLAAMFLLVPLRWILLADAPVLLSLFMVLREPVVMLAVGLWTTASMFSFVLIGLVRGGAWLAGRLRRVPASGTPDGVAIERRYFLQTATYVAGAVPFAVVGYGFFIGRQNYRVQEASVPVPNLPEPLNGLRLLQLTDIHASAYMPVKEIRRVVGLARELDPDLVFHTGDFITSRGDPLTEAVAELVAVQGRYGSFGCLGNHEIYAGTTEATTQLFARHGVGILRGRNAEVEIRGAKLNLIGVDYQRQPRSSYSESWWAKFSLPGVERFVRRDVVNILLTHNPNPFLRAADLGIELTLAGHTHGGQVQVEILDSRWSPARFITRFISGLYSLPSGASSTRRCFLYVSRGIGTIAAPIRLGAPPEITLLTLRRG